MPSLWPSTGMPLAALWMSRTSWDEPLGMIRSINLSSLHRSSTSSRVLTYTRQIFHITGYLTGYCNHIKTLCLKNIMLLTLTSWMASATPWMESASWVSWCRILLVLEASLPPFRSKAFPLAIARADTWNTIDENVTLTFRDSVKQPTIVKSTGWVLGLTDLWETIRTWLKDDKQDTNGDSDLFQV